MGQANEGEREKFGVGNASPSFRLGWFPRPFARHRGALKVRSFSAHSFVRTALNNVGLITWTVSLAPSMWLRATETVEEVLVC